VPPDVVQQTLTLVADDQRVRILRGQTVVAEHARSWGQRQKVEDPCHRAELIRLKRGADSSTGRDRLRAAAPDIDVLVDRWVDAGRNVGLMVAQTRRLLDLYGQDIFAQAVAETIARGTHDPGALGVLCEKYRRAAEQPVPIEVPMGDNVPDRDVVPHDLGGYDDVD
jgi:hypothetical protein